MWLFIVAGVLLVALAGVAALVLSNRGGAMTPPDAEVVTLPVPTPTVDAIARDPGTAFYDALPSTVLGFALSESGAAPDLVTLGAFEGYRLAYTDGSTAVTLLAGQWATADDAATAYAAMTAGGEQSPAVPSPSPSTSAAPSSGSVTVGGTVVGTWSMTGGVDGGAVLTWSNDTVVLQLSGPAGVLKDLYAAFPL